MSLPPETAGSCPPRRAGAQSLCAVLAFSALGTCLAVGCGGREDPVAEARRALEEGRDRDAWRLATRAVERDTTSAEARLARAWAALRTRRTNAGLEEVARAIDLAPEDARARHVLAMLERMRFHSVAAVAAEEEAIRLAPSEARYRIAHGEYLLGGGVVGTPDHGAAESAFREALSLDPGNLRAANDLGEVLVLDGRQDEALEYLERTLEARPNCGEALYYRGLSRLRRRDLEGAESDFAQAVRFAPHDPSAHFNYARVLQMRGRAEESEAARKIHEEVRKLHNTLHDLAFAYHSNSSDFGAALRYVRALTDAGRVDEAAIILESAAEDEADVLRVQRELVALAMVWGLPDLAREALGRALSLALPTPPLLMAGVQIETAADRPQAALVHARAAVALPNSPPECRRALVAALLATERAEDAAEAERLLRELAASSPGDPWVSAHLGEALVRSGQAREAVPVLGRAVRAAPGRADPLHWRGVARKEIGDRSGAETDFRAALRAAPNRAGTALALAELLEASGRPTEAAPLRARHREILENRERVRSLQRRLHDVPGDREAMRELAERLAALGRSAEADALRGRRDGFGVEP